MPSLGSLAILREVFSLVREGDLFLPTKTRIIVDLVESFEQNHAFFIVSAFIKNNAFTYVSQGTATEHALNTPDDNVSYNLVNIFTAGIQKWVLFLINNSLDDVTISYKVYRLAGLE